jgi:hypothetical protein
VVPVSWRRLDHVNVAGYVDLDQVMDPDDETMAYALTFVEAQQATPVALRLGSDEGVKVWVNGELLHAADVRRPARFDQDHVGVELPTGWSALLLKVAEGEGDWRFAPRVTAPDGSPAQGVRWLQPGEEPPAAWPWHPEGPLGDPVQVHRGSVQALEQLDASPDAPAWAARDLGVFLASVHAHDRASRLPQEVLERAVARDPGDASSQYYLAQASRGFAERAADREENRYRAALERTLEVDPEHVVGLEALADYYAILGNLRRARELYERAIVVNPEHVPSLLGLANVLDSRDWPGAMRLQVEELARRHPDCLQVLAAQAEIRSDLDDDHGAARFQERALELQHRNDRLVYELVETYGRAGEDQEALALLQARLVLEPFEGRAYREAANLLAARDRVAEAARYLDR